MLRETCERRTSEEELLQGGRLRGREGGDVDACIWVRRCVCVLRCVPPSHSNQCRRAWTPRRSIRFEWRNSDNRSGLRCCVTHTHTHTHIHSLTHSLTHSLSLTHTRVSQWHASTRGLTDPLFPFGFVQLNGNGNGPAYSGNATDDPYPSNRDCGGDYSNKWGFAGLRWAQTAG